MSEILNLKPLFDAQKALDATIHEQHQTNYAKTHDDRVLALLVELGELANTTRCFKFWSLKGSEVEAIVLDEYADALHFLLSIGIMHGLFMMNNRSRILLYLNRGFFTFITG